jgi:hypothetical protein
MLLDQLIVVDDEISSSFLLDNEGNNATIGGWHHFVIVECGFIWQHSELRFLQSEVFRMGGRTVSYSLALVY